MRLRLSPTVPADLEEIAVSIAQDIPGPTWSFLGCVVAYVCELQWAQRARAGLVLQGEPYLVFYPRAIKEVRERRGTVGKIQSS
jgi:hypothetical protein